MNKPFIYRLDWLTIFCYLMLIVFGFINIYSSTISSESNDLFKLNSVFEKQILFFFVSILIGVFILGIRTKFFQQFSNIIYFACILSLISVLIFGQTINGATSWFTIGGIGIQPSEFGKIGTSLMISKYLSDFQININDRKSIIIASLIILVPSFLIIIQPDPGSAIIFCSLFLVFFREGLSFNYLILIIVASLLFIITLLFSIDNILYSIVTITILYVFISKIKKFKINTLFISSLALSASFFVMSVSFIFNDVFEQRHRDRFNIILGIIEDSKGIGYNINQSKIAIGSGGLTGKGFLKGTQTKGDFVPEQQTDYIFTTVGEEWGFIGSFGLIIVLSILIIRMANQAEKQANIFRRAFIYCICSLLFSHFTVNIGMSLGLFPTVGIPLPFISSGGSNLITFSLLIFIYLNFDANRLNDW